MTRSATLSADARPLAPVAAPQQLGTPTSAKGGRAGSLPQWADCPGGRDLIAQILADPPAIRTYTNGLGGKSDEFAGVPAARLRRLFTRGAADICAREVAAYRAGQPYRQITAELQAYFLQERADDLVRRLIEERGL